MPNGANTRISYFPPIWKFTVCSPVLELTVLVLKGVCVLAEELKG